MSDRALAFSISLGTIDDGFSDKQIMERKSEVRKLLTRLAPVIRYLSYSFLEETIAPHGEELILNYFLVSSSELPLISEVEQKDGVAQESLLARHFRSLYRIKQSALGARLTIAELAELIISIAGGDQSAVQNIKAYEEELRVIADLKKSKVKPIRFLFNDEDISFQFPLIPEYVRDPGEQIIRARVTRLGRTEAAIWLLDDPFSLPESPRGRRATIKLLRPVKESHPRWGMLLAYGMDTGTALTMAVTVVREITTGQLSHFELCSVLDTKNILKDIRKELDDCVF